MSLNILHDLNNSNTNLLPYDGEVCYYGQIYTEQTAIQYYNSLLNSISWQNDSVKIFGKTHIMKRKMAWYSIDNQSYTYSGATKVSLPFTNELSKIKNKIEKLSNETFNSCLANLYHDGHESMGWHADNETEIVKNSAIASVSFGAERYFHLKHKSTKELLKFKLETGSLLIMKGTIQENWLHSMPKSMKIVSPRINLTFRKMIT
jgi:alkylated DNA repair dioxygenase AlkB